MPRHLPVATASTDVLPPLYARWADQLFAGPIPREINATCDDCAMCDDPGVAVHDPSQWFNPETKCCTFLPELPNFLVGRALASEPGKYPAGRRSVEARVHAGVGVTPMGLMQPDAYKLVLTHTIAGFGRSRSLRCPHYIEDDRGRCGIWEHREGTCATWYCKHVRGGVAKLFWNRVQQLLKEVEMALARHCVLHIGSEPAALALMFPIRSPRDGPAMLGVAQVDGVVDAETYALVWGAWHGKEEEFFRRCHEYVDGLSWDEVLTACGSESRALARLAQHAHRHMLDESLPERVRVGSFQVLALTATEVRVQSYSFLDPLILPRVMFDSLAVFDGLSTTDAMAEITRRTGETFSEEAVMKLLDFNILVP